MEEVETVRKELQSAEIALSKIVQKAKRLLYALII